MPSGPRMKQTRMPGRTVVGSLGELDALGLELGRDGVDAADRQPEMVEALIGRGRRRVDAVARRHRRDEDLAPPSLRSMRGSPCCMLRRSRRRACVSNHCAVASGFGLRRWMWSQVHLTMIGAPCCRCETYFLSMYLSKNAIESRTASICTASGA